MAKQDPTSSSNTIPIPTLVGSEFVRPQTLDLIITGDTVKDTTGNKVFKVKTPLFGLHNKRILLDPNDSPILTMKMKVTSKHDRWQVYRGSDLDDKIFTVKRSSTVQLKTRVEVFLKHNQTREASCDFTIKGRFMKRACTIYVGESTKIIAQVHEGDKRLVATIYPNVDHAFIVTLIFIFDLINMVGAGI
ncbi:PREDICTED: protein LURP-one-related 13 [Camelina sativa]|uniref:Protein LURP-one-related 13 n=1 Tax=Camelina sativa TaxID=90675 RepID=A0ABM0W4W0_CAMSA|nr:PREDICTED: protein LURP-one-related 13 [Camelina sativa]